MVENQELWGSPTERLQAYFNGEPRISLLEVLAASGTNPELQTLADANFDIGVGSYTYTTISGLRGPKAIRVGITRTGDSSDRVMECVHGIEGPGQYLEVIRAPRLQAERELWELNIWRLRSSPEDNMRNIDRDVQIVTRRLIEIVASMSQLHGAAQAAIAARNTRHALLLCEAAGDFLPEGETVVRVDGGISRRDSTLELLFRFLRESSSDRLIGYIAQATIIGIFSRLAAEQGRIARFEESMLHSLLPR